MAGGTHLLHLRSSLAVVWAPLTKGECKCSASINCTGLRKHTNRATHSQYRGNVDPDDRVACAPAACPHCHAGESYHHSKCNNSKVSNCDRTAVSTEESNHLSLATNIKWPIFASANSTGTPASDWTQSRGNFSDPG